jgi:para-nitrobenzyl esterase
MTNQILGTTTNARGTFAAIGVSAILAAACADAAPSPSEPGPAGMLETELGGSLEVATHEGVVQGTLLGTTRTFLGIPYVAPPVGDLRWAHPRPHEPWARPLVATAFGARCPQTDITGQPGGEEDCLTLNVWTPKRLATAAPVMINFHGGAFTRGTGGAPTRDGRLLSETTGAIIITINYRLGPLGFLADAALTDEDPTQPSSGNYGFEDQRAALEWVQSNIGAFGGDPGSVTLFGECAGAVSASLHMLSPQTTGLFQRAILESGDYDDRPVSIAARQAQSASLVALAGCSGEPNRVACLRSKSVAEVLNAEPADASWGPVIDGWNIPDCASTLVDAACIASPVPVALGTHLNESEFYFATGLSAPLDDAGYLSMMSATFAGQGAAILAEYPSASFPSPAKAAADVLTDSAYVCPNRRLARTLVSAGLPVFLYSFNHAPVSPMFPDAGAFHTSEVAFVFGSPLWGIQLDEPERALSRAMMGYWGRMAANGNPNGEGALAWPALDSTDANIVFDLNLSTTTRWKGDRCDFGTPCPETRALSDRARRPVFLPSRELV